MYPQTVRQSIAALLLAAASVPCAAAVAERIEPVRASDFYDSGEINTAKVELGRMLFFDKILSGNRNISCASCHHPQHGSSDGLALGLGEGAVGLGPQRSADTATPVLGRVPRNSPALYFLGAREFTRLFHDGRVERDDKKTWQIGFWSPAREKLPAGLDNVLAAQAMFPVTSPVEMAGNRGENEIADAVAVDRMAGPDGAWARIANRLRVIPEYVQMFGAAFDEVNVAEDIEYVHAANAIAAFESSAFRPSGSAFDRYLESGEREALGAAAARGMELFYGDAGCGGCHSGKFQTDHQFHAIAMPQVGPGKDDGFDEHYWQESGFVGRLEDYGRYKVTFDPQDKYRFRTPSLRNVELTGPWGHAGAYASLEQAVRHHLNPVGALQSFNVAAVDLQPLNKVLEPTGKGSQLGFDPVRPERIDDFLKRDRWVQSSQQLRARIAEANELKPRQLSDQQVDDLLAFLGALTDPASRDQTDLVPDRVPSGLPVQD